MRVAQNLVVATGQAGQGPVNSTSMKLVAAANVGWRNHRFKLLGNQGFKGIDNAGFTVQRAEATGTEFVDLGEVMPSGTLSGDYAYVDNGALPGVDYLYRIQQADYDGTLSYSPLASATLAGDEPELSAYPNPASRSVNVRVSGEDIKVTLHDLAGRELRSVTVRNGRARLDVGELPNGVYLLRAGPATKRLVVKAE